MILYFVKHTHTFPRPNLKTAFSTLTILYYEIDIIYFTQWLSLIITLRDDIYQLKLYSSTGTVLYPLQYMRSYDVYFWYCASVIYMYVMTPVVIYCFFTLTFLRLRLIKMHKVSIVSDRGVSISRKDYTNGQTPHVSVSVVPGDTLAISPLSRPEDSSFKSSEKLSSVVERSKKFRKGLSFISSGTQYPYFHRCVKPGLESSF